MYKLVLLALWLWSIVWTQSLLRVLGILARAKMLQQHYEKYKLLNGVHKFIRLISRFIQLFPQLQCLPIAH